jgi:cytidyltransferase-like protein
MKLGIVSGYFNPLHYGHIEYINEAKKRSDKLICIVNSDHQVDLKGSKHFMLEEHRAAIMANLKSVDEVFVSIDKNKSQCASLRFLRAQHPKDEVTFYNSGDRKGANLDTSESKVCEEIGVRIEVLNLPKLYSSSTLLGA